MFCQIIVDQWINVYGQIKDVYYYFQIFGFVVLGVEIVDDDFDYDENVVIINVYNSFFGYEYGYVVSSVRDCRFDGEEYNGQYCYGFLIKDIGSLIVERLY